MRRGGFLSVYDLPGATTCRMTWPSRIFSLPFRVINPLASGLHRSPTGDLAVLHYSSFSRATIPRPVDSLFCSLCQSFLILLDSSASHTVSSLEQFLEAIKLGTFLRHFRFFIAVFLELMLLLLHVKSRQLDFRYIWNTGLLRLSKIPLEYHFRE